MKVGLHWVNEYVPVDMNRHPQELADILTKKGIPVEAVTTPNKGLKKIYTGKIVEITKHPDADKLQVCQVSCLSEEGEPITKQIITAATNVRVGQIVPVAYHKSRLADGTIIKKGKLRGLPSEGMFCSVDEMGIPRELVLPEEADGIYIFPADTPIGKDVKDVLDLEDTVYEFELTANRADCFSVVGLSREFAVMTDQKASLPAVSVVESDESIDGKLQVSVEANGLCSRFSTRLVKGVKVAPSPLWMQNRLRHAGIRPINNVVDITNYVMLELGQPMHAYDYDHLHGQQLTVRKASDKEVIKTLDDTERTLDSDMLVVADSDRAVGVAGVMGGYDSEVTKDTTNVVFEAAVFNAASVRKTARRLGLRSEASGRFERGVNFAFSGLALDRAVQLLQMICPDCHVLTGLVEVAPKEEAKRIVSFTADQINAYLGTDIPEQTMVDILTKLEFIVGIDKGTMEAAVPSWRQDVTGMPDIAEEISRIYGYDNIPSTTPTANLYSGSMSRQMQMTRQVKHALADAGLSEIITFSFMHTNSLKKLLIPESDSRYRAVPILNPITEEFPYMRTSLVPGMLDTACKNEAQKNYDLKLFEVASVYEPKALPVTEQPNEHIMACGFLSGNQADLQWSEPVRSVDFYDVKGIVDTLLAGLFVPTYTIQRSQVSYLHPGVSADYLVDGKVIASFGELHPKVAKTYGFTQKAYLFEIDLAAILNLSLGHIHYQEVSKFPGMVRDLAIVAPKSMSSAEIENVIRTHGGQYLTNTFVFDVYEGEHVAEGYKSLAYKLSFRSNEGTLVDEEVEGAVKAVVDALADIGCQLR